MHSPVEALTNEIIALQDQLVALQHLTQPTGEQISIFHILQRLMQTTARSISVEIVIIWLDIPGQVRREHQSPLAAMESDLLQDAYQKVIQTEKHLLSHESSYAYPHPPGVNSLLLLPIHVNNAPIGMLSLINKKNGRFTAADIKFGYAAAQQSAMQIENLLFYEASLRQVQTQMELQLAHEVQKALLPNAAPSLPGLVTWAYSKPAGHIGGDFYDFIPANDGRLHFCLGDVTGKGVAAGLLMGMTRTSLHHSMRLTDHSPAQTLQQTNTILYDDFTNVAMFITLFVGQYDPQNRELVYANAGHAPVIYCPAHGKAILLEADSAPLGVLPESFAANHQLQINPGDLVVVASDGLTEAMNGNGDFFGYSQLMEAITFLAGLPAASIGEALMSLIDEFAINQPQSDDQTLVVFQGIA